MATNNRSINICLINTLKPTEDLPDNNRIGIDHVNSFIWFDSKKDRDDYFALKTVHSQIQNSKIHDFNAVGTFRIALDMESYYKLDADLLKVNHTQNGIENVYIYNITDVDYTNNGVVEVAVEMNVIYTYLLDDVNERNQLQGVISKSNFKNENVSIGDINNMAKGLIGDNYGATDYSSSIKFVESGPINKDGTSWLVASLRKKPSVVDDAIDLALGGYANTLNSNFSDEIVIAFPFRNDTGLGRSLQAGNGPVRPNANRIGYVAYLLLNGTIALKSSLNGTLISIMAGSYKYVEQLPFTFASLYEISEIGIIPDFPGSYEDGNNIVTMPEGADVLKFTLKDKTKEENAEREIYFTTLKHVNSNFRINQDSIMTNAEKQTKLMNGFENVENNIIYNNYYLKYFNTLSVLNPFNLFGSNADLYVNSIYLGSNFKKLFVSTDLGIGGIPKISQLTGVENTDFVIKYYGSNNGGTTIKDYLADNMIADIDTNNSIISDVVRGGITLGGSVIGSAVPGAGTIAGGVVGNAVGNIIASNTNNTLSKQSSNLKNAARDFNQQGGSSGYNTAQFNASPLFGEMEEYVPKVIYERSGNTSQIDQQTNYFGTSCSIFTNNLKTYIKDVINNRKNHKCFVQGDFRANRLYPQSNEAIRAKLGQGIMLMIKISMQAELEWYRKNKSKGVE